MPAFLLLLPVVDPSGTATTVTPGDLPTTLETLAPAVTAVTSTPPAGGPVVWIGLLVLLAGLAAMLWTSVSTRRRQRDRTG